MELKFRVYSRSASKKRWNEKWKLKLVSGEEFHVTNQLLKIPASDGAAPSDVLCAFLIHDGSLYFQMRDDHRTSIINGVARPDAVVGKGDRIAIDEFAEILVLQAPKASGDGPTVTDGGALDEGDGPTLAMEASVGDADTSGVSIDLPIDPSPDLISGHDDEVPSAPEPTTFMQRDRGNSEKLKAFENSLPDDDSIPDIAADERPEMTKAGLRALLEPTKTQASSSMELDPDRTPPMGIQKPDDLPFETALDPLQDVSDAPKALRDEAQKTKTTLQGTKTVMQGEKTKVTSSYTIPGQDERVELESSNFTDAGIDQEASGVYHAPPKEVPKKGSLKKSKKPIDQGENEITKSIRRLGEKASDLTGALTKRLRNFSSTLTETKTKSKTEAPDESLGTPPSIEPGSFSAPKQKAVPKKPILPDDVTGDGIVIQRSRAHPAEIEREVQEKTGQVRKSKGRAIYFLGGLSLSVLSFALVYILLKPAPHTPIQSLSRKTPDTASVAQTAVGSNPAPTVGAPPHQLQPNQLPPGYAQAVNMQAAQKAASAPAPGNANAQKSAPGNTVVTANPPPVFKNPTNPTVPNGGVASVPDHSAPDRSGLPRGIPIDQLIKKVQRLKAPPATASSSGAPAPGSARTIQGSSR